MTDDDIYFLVWQCKAFRIHPIIAMSFQEKESSTISNPDHLGKYNWRYHRAYGYALIESTWHEDGKKYYKFGHFTVQCHSGVKAIRKSFDRWQKKEYNCIDMKINNGNKTVQVDTVVDYILFRYTPFDHGKEDFMKIYSKFREKWIALNGNL
jgi:glycine/serine hydroxymethyltransferase